MKKRTMAITISILFLIIISAFMRDMQSDPIVGTWVSTQDAKDTWVFTSDNKAKSYYDGELLHTYIYEVTREPIQYGVDMSKRLNDNPGEHILILTDSQTNKQKCDLVYNLTDEHLSLSPFGYYTITLFKKTQ